MVSIYTTQILYGLLAILLGISVLKLLQSYLVKVFAPHDHEKTDLYQGGEQIPVKEVRYSSETYVLTTFFLILHVMGFFGATIYVLAINGFNPFNWTTIIFGAIVLYSILLIRAATGDEKSWLKHHSTQNS